MFRSFLVVVMVLILSGEVAQAQQQFRNWIFQAPTDWHVDVSAKDVVMIPLDLNPKDVEAGEAVGIVLYPGEKLNQDFRTWFDKEVAKMKAKAAVMEEGAISAAETELGIQTLSIRIVLRYTDGTKLHRLIWAAQLGKHVEYLIFVTTNNDLYQRYQGVLTEFLRTVCFLKHPCPEYARLAHKNLPAVPVSEKIRFLAERVVAPARIADKPEFSRGVRSSKTGR